MSDHDFHQERPLNSPPRQGRKPRADGAESRRTILLAAANLATTRGLDGLSIGELARHIGMSKSGLYAHFESKEDLELAAIETAAEIFERDVLAPLAEVPTRGLARVLGLSEAFLSHLERRVFPGGCFFATVAAQLATRPGRARDRVLQVQQQWVGLIAEALTQAVRAKELPRGTDADQLAFEITAMMVRANFAWITSGDVRVLEQARVGIHHVLERAGAKAIGHKGHRGPREESNKA
jgi:AcrR family transcriptional regulator